MKTFLDNAGRTWTVNINVFTVRRVKDLLSVNLLEAIEGKLLEQLSTDPILLCDVIYAICKPEADAQQVTDEEFGRAMGGDAIDRAATALLEDLIDFFPEGRRGVLAKALAVFKKLESKAIEVVTAKLDSPELEKELNDLLTAHGD